ncbi:MAG: ATP-binding protein [Paracoccaceae bacterium]|nr:ATP-binding protein [Paracoccaceae bacterium]
MTLIATVFLGRQVFSDLEHQRSANSDNVQWTLTQVEVEYLSFLNTLEHLQHITEEVGQPAELGEIRRDFDIFYSRVDTLRSARLFRSLRETPEFSGPLMAVSGFLEDAVPVIDADDGTLSSQSDAILQRGEALRGDVRALSVAGLGYFAQQSDDRRADTARTLAQLATFSGALLLALTAASIYLLFVNREIRRGSESLAQVNQRMNTVLSTSLDAVIVSDKSGDVLAFNPAAEAIFGYRADEVMGRPIGDLIVPKHLRDAHQAGMERMRQGGEMHVVGKGRVQLEAMRANGEIFPVELALQFAKDGDYEIIISFIRDISRRVSDEKELINARDKALAGQKAKDEFLTVMSHEIRTPLNGILGNLSLLKNTRLTKDQKQFARNMEISGEVMLNHVNSVLDVARYESGKLSLEEKALNLSVLLQDISDSQGGHAAQNNNVLRWQWVGDARPWVKADAHRVRQIILNLVGNAIKFTHGGQVTVEIEVTGQSVGPDKPIYEIRVIDTGVGLSEGELETVFEDFQTGDTSLNRTSGGTGLGLGIARRLTRSMGGDIGVESVPGEGSVFWVHLPLAASEPMEKSYTGTTAHDAEVALDLLVVEDNEINRLVIQKMLEQEGHRVTTASDGRSGVELAGAHAFDAVLMDISMPVMDGLTATRRIREGAGLSAEAPIIAVSANVLPDAVEKFHDVGMNAFVSKPIDIANLRKALRIVTSHGVGGFDAETEVAPLEQMRADLGEATFDRLLSEFVDQTDALMGQLKKAAWQHDGQQALKMECHRIAGSAALFGLESLREVLIQTENAIEQSAHDELTLLTHRAKGLWATARKRLPVRS